MKSTRKIIHLVLFAITTLIFIFSLLSGAEPDIQGSIKNIPNTLPWLLLYFINIISFYNEIIGGIILIILTIFLFNFFNIIPNDNWVVFLLIVLPIFTLGILLVFIGISNRKKN